ncbi:hypothetical protein V490_09312 [Pseudogymnoascus sp. VKM F-3557]|nr:hypothetical protein V490_09312 [Pseudogymnoascus sp. VKM F-3557]
MPSAPRVFCQQLVECFRINHAKIPKEQVSIAALCLVAISLRASMAARHVTGINGIAIVAIVTLITLREPRERRLHSALAAMARH